MIRISSNAKDVRDRFLRFRERVTKIPAEVSDPNLWIDRAKTAARDALMPIAGANASAVDEFVNTVTVIAFGMSDLRRVRHRMIWSMERVKNIAISVFDLTDEQKESIFANRRQILDREMVEEWVLEAKEQNEDDPADQDQVVARVLAVLFGTETEERKDKAWNLLFGNERKHKNYLLEYKFGRLLGQKETDNWLTAVVKKWREVIMDELPPMIRQRLVEAWRASA